MYNSTRCVLPIAAAQADGSLRADFTRDDLARIFSVNGNLVRVITRTRPGAETSSSAPPARPAGHDEGAAD